MGLRSIEGTTAHLWVVHLKGRRVQPNGPAAPRFRAPDPGGSGLPGHETRLRGLPGFRTLAGKLPVWRVPARLRCVGETRLSSEEASPHEQPRLRLTAAGPVPAAPRRLPGSLVGA